MQHAALLTHVRPTCNRAQTPVPCTLTPRCRCAKSSARPRSSGPARRAWRRCRPRRRWPGRLVSRQCRRRPRRRARRWRCCARVRAGLGGQWQGQGSAAACRLQGDAAALSGQKGQHALLAPARCSCWCGPLTPGSPNAAPLVVRRAGGRQLHNDNRAGAPPCREVHLRSSKGTL